MSSSHIPYNRKTFSRRKPLLRLMKRIIPVFQFGWMLVYSLFFAAVIFFAMHGIDWLSSALITSTGQSALTSSNFLYFFRSWHGYAIVIVLLLSLGLLGAIIMNGVIFLSDDMLHLRDIHFVGIMKRSVSSLRLFLCKEAVPLVLYYYIFVLFFTISLLSILPGPFEIPGYIRYLLSKRIWATALYFVSFILVCIPLLRNPLLLHDILLKQLSPKAARFRTRSFVQSNRGFIFRELLLSVLSFCAILLFALCVFLYLPMMTQTLSGFLSPAPRRILVLTASYLGLSFLGLVVLLALWILPVKISMLYHCMASGFEKLPSKRRHRPFFRYFLPVCLALVAAAVVVSYLQFNYLYPPAKKIEAVVHRLGGDLDTENTMEGMEKALELGAGAFETDIQRTRDGEYVIFHDATLKRMCGIDTKISEMTLDEIRKVQLPSPDWEERHIPLLTDVLDRVRGQGRLYLELKGSSADIQMVQDVARMIRARDMEDDCVLISLNYNLVNYIAHRIPDIQCGYLYFFAYGSPSSLSGNILLAQSNAISAQRTRAIHSKGKKMYCWTVNSRQTALNMVRQRVDGIISDRYDIVSSLLRHMESRNDYERIMDVLLS